MPRSRNIKPGFFTNEDIVELDFAVRLLFIGLWTLADRDGRLEDRPKKIKLNLFPADDVDIDQMVSRLAAAGFVERYEVAGVGVIQILGFAKHQNPHPKEAKSVLPPKPAPILGPRNFMAGNENTGPAMLIPSYLIPDSLIPPNSGGAPAPAREAPDPTPAGAACIAMRAHGVASVNPSHPELLRLLEAGVTAVQFGDLAAELREAKGSAPTFAYLLATMRGRCEDASARPVKAPVKASAKPAGNANSQWVSSLNPKPADEAVKGDHDAIDVPTRRLG